MKALIKIGAAVVLLVLACFCLSRFRGSYVGAELKRGDLNDAVAEVTNTAALTASTNIAAGGTNPIVEVAPPAGTNEVKGKAAATVPLATPPGGKDAGSKSFGWLAGFIGSLLILGGLSAWEIASWFANRAHSSMFATDTPPESSPEYDEAEQVAMNGDYLDAIQMMRDYLKKNPSEQYVAIRIAEIYEKDLNNYVAAAIELEEVLNKKIPREKWGWTAVHLANIYSGRLGKPEQAIEVLRRIIKEAPNTAAAKKAWERVGNAQSSAVTETSTAVDVSATVPADQDPNLPKGFAPKKR